MGRPGLYAINGLRSSTLYGPVGAFNNLTTPQSGIVYSTTGYYYPFFLPGPGTITSMYGRIEAQDSAVDLKAALFYDSDGVPGELAFDGGTLDMNQSPNVVYGFTGEVSATLDAGTYWIGWSYGSGGGEETASIAVSSSAGHICLLGYDTSGNKVQFLKTTTSGYSAFPQSDASGNTYTAETTTSGRGAPAIWVSL
jgi:hypothetical protein